MGQPNQLLYEKIGVIKNVRCGFGGYQEAMTAFIFILGTKEWSATCEIIGSWAHISEKDLSNPKNNYQWTHQDRVKEMGAAFWRVIELMKKAKVDDLNNLIGKPVRAYFDGEFGPIKKFEILEEGIL